MKEMGGPGSAEPGRGSVLARFGPLVGICVVLAAVLATLIVTTPDDGDDEVAAAPGGGAPTTAVGAELPEGVLPWRVAEARGEVDDIDWGARCDTTKGNLALPVNPLPECFAPYDGPSGGDTATGVTGDAIKVVVYVAQENDPILSFIYSQIGNDDTSADTFATYEGYNEILSAYMETYGRRVELVRYTATGAANDPVAATTDAETIARDLQPFLVIGGPVLTEAFADTLAANQVMCVTCTPGQTIEWYEQRAPYVWDIQKNVQQSAILAAEYVGKRLADGNAEFGGPDVADQPRKFGLIYLSTGPSTEAVRSELEATLRDDYGVQFADVASFTSPVGMAGEAREMLARMKSQGVTTILYSGDPLAPQTLTTTATEQDYHPEWVITGSSLVDTTIFSRTYDQEQWAHAFGPSNLFARVSANVAGAAFLYRWYYGTEPPARTSAAIILPNLQFLYSIVQGIGPNLTPDGFRTAIFAAEIVDSTVISPQISWGERGIWPGIDFAGVDDQTEVWWDADAVGQDETGKEGSGMWTYVDGGTRYLPGEWPESPPRVFDPEGAVTMYTDLPDGITLPDYEPLPPG
jgi:hypothetical protein